MQKRPEDCTCPCVMMSNIVAVPPTALILRCRYGDGLNSVVHFEAIVAADGGCVPVEINMRIAGAETFTMVRAAYGLDLAVAALNLRSAGAGVDIIVTTLSGWGLGGGGALSPGGSDDGMTIPHLLLFRFTGMCVRRVG